MVPVFFGASGSKAMARVDTKYQKPIEAYAWDKQTLKAMLLAHVLELFS
jgi:hypothetical protein